MPLSPLFFGLLLHFFIIPHFTAFPLPSLQQDSQQNCPEQWIGLFLKADLCLKAFTEGNYPNAIQTCDGLNATLLDAAKFEDPEYKLMAAHHLILPNQLYWVENVNQESCTELFIGQNTTTDHKFLNPADEKGCEIINLKFICKMKPLEIETTTLELKGTTTIEGESTTITNETSIPRNETLAPSTNGCADEFEIQLYLEIQG